MANQQGQFCRIDYDFMLGRLQGQDIGYIFIGNRVTVGLKLDIALKIADSQVYFGTVIRMTRQGLQGILLLLQEQLQRWSAGGIVDMQI